MYENRNLKNLFFCMEIIPFTHENHTFQRTVLVRGARSLSVLLPRPLPSTGVTPLLGQTDQNISSMLLISVAAAL